MMARAGGSAVATPGTRRTGQVNPFVVVFPGRCGSTYMMEALARHPQVHAELEVFARMRRKKRSAAEQIEWARGFLSSVPSGHHAAVGFKTKLRDIPDCERFEAVLRDVGANLVHLSRRNLVKLTVSSFNSERLAAATGDWNLYTSSDRLPPAVLDPDAFDARLRQYEQLHQRELEFIARLSRPTLSLCYEELLCNEAGTFRRLLDFLGAAPMELRGDALKATSDDLRESLENFDGLRARYAGTTYEPMFDEVLAIGPGVLGETAPR